MINVRLGIFLLYFFLYRVELRRIEKRMIHPNFFYLYESRLNTNNLVHTHYIVDSIQILVNKNKEEYIF